MTVADYNRRVSRALQQAQDAVGIRSAAEFARRIAARSGGAPDTSTYQRWLRAETNIPAWALVMAAEEAQSSVDTLLGIGDRDTERMSRLEAMISDLQRQMSDMQERLNRQPAEQPQPSTPDGKPIVASAIIVRDGHVLMTRRRWDEGPLRWNYVTGQVEPGETPEQAAVREVREEVGLDIAVERRLGERVHPASGRYMVYFACRLLSSHEPSLVDHEENVEIRWSTLDEADKLLVPTGGIWQPVREYLQRAMVATT